LQCLEIQDHESIANRGEQKQLQRLYWKIYGISHITNNELYLWLVKGWIAKSVHNFKVNWAEATTTIIAMSPHPRNEYIKPKLQVKYIGEFFRV